jgi:two-component system, NtrC family, nitrogen regulation sensor histidine kinase NtrY
MKSIFKYPHKLGTRIYISMLALLGGSFFFIGIFTFYNFKNQNKEYHNKRLLRKEYATLSSVAYFLDSEKAHEHSATSIYELFQHKIFELADIHNLDIIIYNLKGDLILSSNKDLLESDIIPHKIHYHVLKSLSDKKNRIKESLTHNGMDYLNSYQYIIDTRGNPIAVISIPYFQLDESYKRDIRTYLVALSPIYIILFLGASIMAFLLSRQITEPMRRLSQIMRKAALMKRYMPLKWNSSDEIGQLVHQYNFMVKELEKSADVLAQTQKESAWKEMAKQVAHEIKNPLTPMKLNVQLFERHLKPTDPEFEQKLKVFSASIIEQIDTLAHIASAFSDFARMPSSNKEKINLCEIVDHTIAFYDAVQIQYTKTLDHALVFVDQNQIIRVLNNVLNNAIEAMREDVEPEIVLCLELIEDSVLLTIKDNGHGIPVVLHDKIFEPNFTTKNSGMGLGLAMVKRIVDDIEGNIYFESQQNKGTTFYISLPLLKQKS